MSRTTVNVDDELFREATEALGTNIKRPSETINQALQCVVDERRRREAVAVFQQLDYDFSSENMAGAWR